MFRDYDDDEDMYELNARCGKPWCPYRSDTDREPACMLGGMCGNIGKWEECERAKSALKESEEERRYSEIYKDNLRLIDDELCLAMEKHRTFPEKAMSTTSEENDSMLERMRNLNYGDGDSVQSVIMEELCEAISELSAKNNRMALKELAHVAVTVLRAMGDVRKSIEG